VFSPDFEAAVGGAAALDALIGYWEQASPTLIDQLNKFKGGGGQVISGSKTEYDYDPLQPRIQPAIGE
jgi:hypothetical protein